MSKINFEPGFSTIDAYGDDHVYGSSPLTTPITAHPSNVSAIVNSTSMNQTQKIVALYAIFGKMGPVAKLLKTLDGKPMRFQQVRGTLHQVAERKKR
jgi:hypothetical protein